MTTSCSSSRWQMRMLRTLLCSDSRARYSKKHVIIPSLCKDISSSAACHIRFEVNCCPNRIWMARHTRHVCYFWRLRLKLILFGDFLCEAIDAQQQCMTLDATAQLPLQRGDGRGWQGLQALLHYLESPHWNGLLLS